MSFSRAKLQRFNDTLCCAPAPGAYDPKFNIKVKGVVIEKKERFAKPKCTTVDLDSSSVSSGPDRSTSNYLPVVRTPLLQRKAGTKDLSNNRTADSKQNCKESHSKQLMPCTNNDAIIHDLEAQIRTLTCRINELEHEIVILQEFQRNLEDMHNSQSNELLQKHDDAVAELEKQMSRFSELQEKLCLCETQLKQTQTLCSELELHLSSQREVCEQHLQENIDLMSCVEVLEKDKESYLIAKGEICNLRNTNYDLMNQLQSLAKAVSKVHKLEERLLSLESEKCDVGNKQDAKRELLTSLQSDLSSLRVELEARFENEKVPSTSCSGRQDHENESQQCKIMSEEQLELVDERGQRCTSSRPIEARLQRFTTSREEECLQQSHDNDVNRLLDETVLILQCKGSTVEALHEGIELSGTKLAEQHNALHNLGLACEAEVDHVKEIIEDNLNKVLFENASIMELKECVIKSSQEDVTKMEAKIVDQQHEFHALKTAQATEIHEEGISSTLHENVSVTASEENLRTSLQQNKVNHKTKLTDEECDLDDVIIREENAKCLCVVNADGVNKTLPENTFVMDSNECIIQALRKTITDTEMELAGKQRELDTLKIHSKNEVKRIQAFHKEEVDKLLRDNAAIIKSKEASLQTLQVNVRDTEAKLLHKTRECDDLQISQVENRLTIIELQDTIDTISTDLNAEKARVADVCEKLLCKEREYNKLEVSRKNACTSLDAVKVRLLETEEYVEKLTSENEALVMAKRHLELEVRSLEEKLEREKLTIDNMEKEMRTEIECVKSSLLAKVDEFRKTAENRENTLQVANLKKQEIVDSLSLNLEDLQTKLKLMNENIRTLESRNNKQEDKLMYKEGKISELTEKLSVQQMLLASATEASENLAKVVENQRNSLMEAEVSGESLKARLSELESRNSEMEDLRCELRARQEAEEILKQKVCELTVALQQTRDAVQVQAILAEHKDQLNRCLEELEAARVWESRAKELESLVGPFREQLQAFEMERSTMQEFQKTTEQELRQLALKYADMLGHQNHQQKIKHLVQLKAHNLELKQEKEKLELRVKQQKLVIDKLKEEMAMSQRKRPVAAAPSLSTARGKENDSSPGKNFPLQELGNRHK